MNETMLNEKTSCLIRHLINAMFILSTSTICSAQSTSGQRFQTVEKARQAINTMVRQRKECVTVISDSDPPTNIRSLPTSSNSSIIGKLKPFVFINVVNNQNGWLEINSPVKGWVSVNLTLAGCGEFKPPNTQAFKKLAANSLAGDQNSFDLLVRYTYQDADGVWADIIQSEVIPKLLQKQPDLFIATLDNQTENGRRKFLKFFLDDASTPQQREQRENFKISLAKHKNSPTAKTWQSLNLK
jgi:hypothetical protein